jgi:hypothetical protein
MTVTRFINSAYTGPTSYFTTELNSLGIGAVSSLGAAINNTSARDTIMTVQISLASAAFTGSPNIFVRFVQSIDGGTTYEDNDTSAWGVTLPIAATTAAHVRSADFAIPPGHFKLQVVNNTGVALAASGNTLTYVVTAEVKMSLIYRYKAA